MSGEIPFSEMAATFEAGKRPVEKLIGNSLRELISGEYMSFYLNSREGSHIQETVVIDLLRLIVIRNGRLRSIIISGTDDPEINANAQNIMRTVSFSTEVDPRPFGGFEDAAIEELSNKGLSTVAGVNWGHEIQTGERRIQLIYPRTFMTLLPSLSDEHKEAVAFGVATYFIQKTASYKGQFYR